MVKIGETGSICEQYCMWRSRRESEIRGHN